MTTKEKLKKFEEWKQEKLDTALNHRDIDRHCENCRYGERVPDGIIEMYSYGCLFKYIVKCSARSIIIPEPEAYTAPTKCKDFKFLR